MLFYFPLQCFVTLLYIHKKADPGYGFVLFVSCSDLLLYSYLFDLLVVVFFFSFCYECNRSPTDIIMLLVPIYLAFIKYLGLAFTLIGFNCACNPVTCD